jgi:hypothetical protein
VGADDNFFDLGGNSLLLQSVHVKAQARMGLEFPLVELFQFPTVRLLAAHLSRSEQPAEAVNEAPGGNRREGARRLAQLRRNRPASS